MKKQFPITIFLTGLPCSGKTTIAENFIKKWNQLNSNNKFSNIPLDGDHLRLGLTSHLGFSEEDRKENMRIVGHLSQLINKMGMSVICSFVSPTQELRQEALKSIENVYLVYIQCSVDKCSERDVKGMWAKAKSGDIKMFTGFSAPFENPVNPDLILDTEKLTIDECVNKIIEIIT